MHAGRLPFMGIPAVIEAALERLPAGPVRSFDTLYDADAEARRVAAEQVGVPRRQPVTSPRRSRDEPAGRRGGQAG